MQGHLPETLESHNVRAEGDFSAVRQHLAPHFTYFSILTRLAASFLTQTTAANEPRRLTYTPFYLYSSLRPAYLITYLIRGATTWHVMDTDGRTGTGQT